MSDDRLTPEERAVIEAALAVQPGLIGGPLEDAIDALKASLRPQPVECLMSRGHGERTPDGWILAYGNLEDLSSCSAPEVWRVTITPIERVR